MLGDTLDEGRPRIMAVANLFVSHAVSDLPLVKEVVKLLEGGIGVPAAQIFCSSLKGQGIKPGNEFKESIKNSLQGAGTVVALISENFYSSPFCMCELGGVWLASKDFIPILVPPVTYSGMKAVLSGLQALKIEVAADLDELRDELVERLELKNAHKTPRWTERRDEFLAVLGDALTKLGQPATVPRAYLEKAHKELEEYLAELGSVKEQLNKQTALVTKLQAAKDKKAVESIIFEDLPEKEAFVSLAKKASTALSKLTTPTREALFSAQQGEDFRPEAWDDEAKTSLAYKEVLLNDQQNGFSPNPGKPAVAAALKAIEALEKWLTSADRSHEFSRWYEATYRGESPDLEDRSFWDRHLW